MARPIILFQGKYDLNTTQRSMTLDTDACDGSREETTDDHEVLAMARWAQICIAVERPDGLSMQDIFCSREETGPIDAVLRLAPGSNIDFASLEARTADGEAFVARFLRHCEVRVECRECGNTTLVGEEIFEHHCTCEACRR